MFSLKVIVQFREFCFNHNEIIFFIIFRNILQCNAWPDKRRKTHVSIFRGTFCIVLSFKQALHCNIYQEESHDRKETEGSSYRINYIRR